MDAWEDAIERYEQQRVRPRRKILTTYARIASAAAAMIIICSIGIYFFGKTTYDADQSAALTAQMKPGGNRAVLRLGDGTEILLEDTRNGEIVSSQGVRIVKEKNGRLIYQISDVASPDGKIAYNTIVTPRGGQYQVQLPDGTQVWLNAASSLRYPTRFDGKERKVELQGEGYFEVAKNPRKPFRVVTDNQDVKVLGTHFNVSSYKEDPEMVTTVLEGKVSVGSAFLTRNQQASLNLKNNKLRVSAVRSDLSISWKNGKFQFQGAPVEEVLKQFSRWYNVDFEYTGHDKLLKLSGEVNRNVNAAEALEILQFFGLKYVLTNDGSHKKILITN
jgi:ferric-dicitrate binding protein FerR (iron transport regulator)